MAAFWAGDLLDRPPVLASCAREGAPAVARWPQQLDGFDGDFAGAAEVMDAAAGATYYAAEAFPNFAPCWGPDQFAAFLGAEIVTSPDSGGTTWVHPFVEDWSQALPLRWDEDNFAWRQMLDFCAFLKTKAAGRALLCTLDTHSNVDGLGAIRGYGRLCMDMLDQPEVIDRAVTEVREFFAPVYDAIAEAAGMFEVGYTTSWLGVVGAGRTAAVQCDFAALMSPPMFDRWVMPCLEDETEFVDHSIYHLDGPEALCHVPSLLSLPELHGIQWVPGAARDATGREMFTWVELLQQFQAAGKSVYAYGPIEALKTLHQELRPELVIYSVNGGPSRAEIDEFLQWLCDHS
ncbi:MAG TPA: hypothetical protein VGM19_01450 [Armatimonadota bacterium]